MPPSWWHGGAIDFGQMGHADPGQVLQHEGDGASGIHVGDPLENLVGPESPADGYRS